MKRNTPKKKTAPGSAPESAPAASAAPMLSAPHGATNEGGSYVNTANAAPAGIRVSPENGNSGHTFSPKNAASEKLGPTASDKDSGAVSAPAVLTKQKTGKAQARSLRALEMRRGQLEYFRGTKKYRVSAFVARRQYGKTTTFAKIALYKMMKEENHTVVFGSAKLNLSREIVRKESDVIRAAIEVAIAEAEETEDAGRIQIADQKTGEILERLTPDDFAGTFEAQRLEFRYYHSRNTYSRTKVIALTADAVGETGDMMADELRALPGWREIFEAVEPIISSNPDYRLTLSTTIPRDDKHYAFDQLMPPVGTQFPPRPEGNWYQSEHGIWVLRLDAFDAYKDGVPIYDSVDGTPLDPAEARRRSRDKDAWDRNYGCKFLTGGTAACGTVQLNTAQTKGINQCAWFMIEDDDDLRRAIDFLLNHIGPGPVGCGWDLATTEKQTSNPNGFAVCEQQGIEIFARVILSWKTNDPAIARKYARTVLEAIAKRPVGGPARRLCIDASNERYFATDLRTEFAGLLPVELVINSETIKQPGEEESITLKQYLGAELVAELDDNHLILPPERFITEDFRRVVKERGQFNNELGPNGEHADSFDGTKLGIRALRSNGGAMESTAGITFGANHVARQFRPRQWVRHNGLIIPGGAA